MKRDIVIYKTYELCKEFVKLKTDLEEKPIGDEELTAITENKDKLEEYMVVLANIEEEDKMLRDVLAEQIKQATLRLKRLDKRNKHVRQTICNVMRICDIKRITMPSVTISKTKSKPSVKIEDQRMFFFDNPHYYIQQEPKLNKKELLNDLKCGIVVDGAELVRDDTIIIRRT